MDQGIVYRETRAQELTEILWSHKANPWFRRINMLGEKKSGKVSQAAFIRALTASFVKSWGGTNKKLGGLFGAPIHDLNDEILYWNRTQQGAFLVFIWKLVYDSIKSTSEAWALKLRELEELDTDLDAAFISKYSLLSSDQGIRGILQITNDLCYVGVKELELQNWVYEYTSDVLNIDAVSNALGDLENQKVKEFLKDVFDTLMKFDWRTYSTPDLEEGLRINQMAFRGSGGYREIRRQLLKVLVEQGSTTVSTLAKLVNSHLGY